MLLRTWRKPARPRRADGLFGLQCMTIGHSAGVEAALAVASDRDVQKLDYPALHDRLIAHRQVLTFPKGYKKAVSPE